MDDSPDDMLALVGARIKERRLELGLTQGEFGRRAGFVKQYANRVEAGQQNLNLRSLHRIATALDTTMAALLANVPLQKH